MDLAALQLKINNYITVVSSWVRNVGKLYFSGTPENITVDMIDDNGNLTTSTLPNVAQFRKTVWDDVVGALGQFNKKLYVNYESGDDNNSGTSSNPFKTIQKAVDSCPIGGQIHIVLLGNAEHIVNDRIEAINKIITVQGYKDATIVRYLTGENNNYNYTYGWNLRNSTILYTYIQIIGDSVHNPDKGDEHGYYGAIHSGFGSKVFIHNYGQTAYGILIPNNGLPFIRSSTRDNKGDVSLSQSYNRVKVGRPLIEFQHNAGVGEYTEFGQYERKDFDGNDINPIDVLSGVIKDSNGVPRNVLSNCVL